MSFWEKIQQDLKENLQEGLEIFKEGSSVVTEKIEKLTSEGKKKYTVFNSNMKLQEEFAKLGGEIYELVSKKSKNPLASSKVKSIIAGINKLESQIYTAKSTDEDKPVKTAGKKSAAKKTTRKSTGKTTAKTTRKTTRKSAAKTVRKKAGRPAKKKSAARPAEVDEGKDIKE